MFIFVKFLKGHFQRVFCNDKHGYLKLLNGVFLFQSLKIILLLDQIKKEIQIVKKLGLFHLVTLDPILESTDERLVVKTYPNVFPTYD